MAGPRKVAGAALLAAEAALRAGAGKLHIATAASVQSTLAIAVPEAKVSVLLEDSQGNLRRMRADLAKDLDAAAAVLVGPGMDACRASERLVHQVANSCSCPLVLDAGALEGYLASPRRPYTRIITPHFGEMARLTGRAIQEIDDDPLQVALKVAHETLTVVVLKSPTTYVASPEGACWVHLDGSIGLGTSGSGDVLAGLITGLVARGATAEQAAVWGVRLHGKAGEVLASRLGTVGFLAREVSPEVPRLLAQLEASYP
jgi:hydroxyethylthiazole kinase-like uncharacterized protein yjeF